MSSSQMKINSLLWGCLITYIFIVLKPFDIIFWDKCTLKHLIIFGENFEDKVLDDRLYIPQIVCRGIY